MTGYLPMTTVMELARQGIDIPFSAWVFVFLYVITVGFSRLYLGVHSTYDIAGGAILGGIVIQFVHMYGDIIASVVYMGKNGILVTAALVLAFLTIYPKPAKGWAASYGTSAQIFGSWMGIASSLWYVFNVDTSLRDVLLSTSLVPWFGEIYSLNADGVEVLATTLVSTTPYSPYVALTLRLTTALTFSVAVKLLSKVVAAKIFMTLVKSDITPILEEEERDVFGRPVPLEKAYWVEVPVRLISYGSLAWAVVVAAPMLWTHFNLV
eukprot:gene22939-29123_t